MCAFHYWLALITKSFQAVGNNGFRRQLNCPARFARDSLIGMQHFTCAFSPTIGCHAPLLPSQTLRNLLRHVWTNDSTLYFECEMAKKSREGNFGNEKGPMVVETSVVLSDFLARSQERGVEREISANFLPG